MIALSPRLISMLSQPAIEPFYLVQIGDSTRLTSYLSELALSDGRVFLPGDLVSLDPPRLSSSVDRESYKITIADPRMEYGAMFESGMVGTLIAVNVGFIDQGTKQPELNINNVFTIYKGHIDSVAYQISLDEVGSSVAVITCASPMSNLDMAKPFYTSRDFIRQINADDSSFDQIYEGAGPVQLKWGKV